MRTRRGNLLRHGLQFPNDEPSGDSGVMAKGTSSKASGPNCAGPVAPIEVSFQRSGPFGTPKRWAWTAIHRPIRGGMAQPRHRDGTRRMDAGASGCGDAGRLRGSLHWWVAGQVGLDFG